MSIHIDFEKIQGIIDYVIQAKSPTYNDIVNLLVSAGFTEESAKNWINQFIQIMCNFLGFNVDINNCFNWIKAQTELGKNSNILTEQLIGMFGTLISNVDVVVIYKNGVLYKEFAPLNIARVNFNDVLVNLENDEIYVIFTYRDNEYKFKLEDAPDKFKQIYKAKCVLNKQLIPDILKNVDISNLNLTDLEINFNIS